MEFRFLKGSYVLLWGGVLPQIIVVFPNIETPTFYYLGTLDPFDFRVAWRLSLNGARLARLARIYYGDKGV